ncbi:hypothetical protein PMAYCL1PPCAC_27502 [Pristionchus mayeri]|uniref:Uncharacterized protein n=1 Tax=Pristionchus mayeri TaxID=1317129 RepID=A0AAN5D7T9_9BILA|nr:hypothetical protein PMAYCL1PPCAC_27502 [Pristionchus mayeri]
MGKDGLLHSLGVQQRGRGLFAEDGSCSMHDRCSSNGTRVGEHGGVRTVVLVEGVGGEHSGSSVEVLTDLGIAHGEQSNGENAQTDNLGNHCWRRLLGEGTTGDERGRREIIYAESPSQLLVDLILLSLLAFSFLC